MPTVRGVGLIRHLHRAGGRQTFEKKCRMFASWQVTAHRSEACEAGGWDAASHEGPPDAPATSTPPSLCCAEGSSADAASHYNKRSEEGGAVAIPAWPCEARPGGRLHLREHKRLFALTSSRDAAAATDADASREQLPYNWGVPMIHYRSAAERRRQQDCSRGTLLQKQCMQAIVEFGTEVERSWVDRHLSNAKEDLKGSELERIFRRAEIRGYLRFLAHHLPSLELQCLVSSFLSASLYDMDEEQMRELLHLLQLGEREEETKTHAAGQRMHVEGGTGRCALRSEFCCYGQQQDSEKASENSSKGCCCGGFTADSLLKLLRCSGGDPCVPPCLRGNTALRRLLIFVNEGHPLLRFLPPPGAIRSL